jgi:hypothetical protein
MSQLPWDRFGSAPEPDLGAARYDVPGTPAVVMPEQPVPYEPPAQGARVDVYRQPPRYTPNELQEWLTQAVAEAMKQQKKGNKPMDKLKEIRKAVVAFLGSLIMVLTFVTNSFGWALPSNGEAILLTVVGVLTTVVTWLVPNAPATPAATGTVKGV